MKNVLSSFASKRAASVRAEHKGGDSMFSIWYLAPIASCVLGPMLLIYGLHVCLFKANDTCEEDIQFLLVAIGGTLLAFGPPLMWLPIVYG